MPSIAGFWDGGAATFDHEPDHGLRDAAVRSAWTARVASWAPRDAAEVLDVGCGTGTIALVLAAQRHRLTLIDLSRGMLARARAKLADSGIAARLMQADAATHRCCPPRSTSCSGGTCSGRCPVQSARCTGGCACCGPEDA